MNTLFVYLASIAMLTRLPLLSTDGPVGGRRVITATVVQLAAMLLLTLTPFVGVAGVGLCLVNGGWWAWEKRFAERGVLAPRIFTAVALLLLLGLACSPSAGLSFRPDLASAVGRFGFYFLPASWLETVSWPSVLRWMCGALLSLSEVNLLVRVLIENLALKPKPQTEGGVQARGMIVGGEYARGRVIGMLERLIVFSLVSSGEFGALGLVIAAKGLARFKDLQEREFAEYFLVGTMLSIVLAGGIGAMMSLATK